MIQRIQTLWLSLTAIVSLLTLKYSFFSGNISDASAGRKFVELTAVNNFFILLLTIAVAVISIISIFIYKNRKLQLRLVILATILGLVTITLYYIETKKYLEGNFVLTSVLSFTVPVFLVLAARGIYSDEKLIKNADRLR